MSELSEIEGVVQRLLLRAHQMEPQQVPQVVAETVESTGWRDVEIFLVDHQQVNLRSLSSDRHHSVEGTLAGDAFRRKRAHVVDHEAGGQRFWVSLIDGEDRLGVLTAVVDEGTDDVIEAAHILATCAAGLIVSKQAYTDGFEFTRRAEPMDLAAEFRWSLLPPLTMWTPRVRIAGMLEPAYEIAGDAFDYALNDDTAHFAMFDAVGHGLHACQLVNLALMTARNCRRAGAGLTDTAIAIDENLRSQFGDSWYVTALLGELDVARGVLRWMTAGHPVPLLLRDGKVIGALEANPGMPLGLGGKPPVPAQVQLEPDDAVFCYSDGVSEARNAQGLFFGEDRVADYLGRAAADELPPAETVRRLVLSLYEHNPAPLNDDATMLLVNWTRPADAAHESDR